MNKSEINHKNYLKYKVNIIKKSYARVLDTDRGLVFFPGVGMTIKDFFNLPEQRQKLEEIKLSIKKGE